MWGRASALLLGAALSGGARSRMWGRASALLGCSLVRRARRVADSLRPQPRRPVQDERDRLAPRPRGLEYEKAAPVRRDVVLGDVGRRAEVCLEQRARWAEHRTWLRARTPGRPCCP